jgi:hypothetical protein
MPYDGQVHQSRCMPTISAVFGALADLQPAEEMQQNFGEDSIWVYEILRYAHVNYDGREITEQAFPEGSTRLKVRSERRCHAHGSEHRYPTQ